jgi:parvulin-like peptidyl-prolyl isomerase
MRHTIFLFASLFTFFFITPIYSTGNAQQNKQNKEIVARVGNDYMITLDDLRQYVFDWFYNKRYDNITEAYTQALDAMITNQLKRIDFFEKGLNKDEKLIKSIRRIINEEMVAEYFATQYLDKYSNEDYAREIYRSMNKQVVYQQIVLKKPKDASKKQIDSVKQKAMEIKAEIDELKDFGQLVGKYSQDTASVNSNGYMPPVGWEQSFFDPTDNAVFRLNSGDVRVVEASDGFHLVKIINTKIIKVEPFDKIKNEIIAKLKKYNYDLSQDEFERDKRDLIDESSLQWNEIALTQIMKWSHIPKFYNDVYKDTLQYTISHNENMAILTYSKGRVKYEDFLRLLNDVLLPKFPENIKKKDVKDFILEAVRTDLIAQKAELLGIEKNIFNSKTINPVLKNQIAVLYNKAEIESKIPEPTSEILHNFYNENKDSLYYQLEKINVYAMIYADMKEAEKTMLRIKNGTPFEKITGSWFVKTFIRNRKGNILSYLSTEKPFLGAAAFKLTLNETAGPVEYNDPEKGEQYAIIKCINIRPEKQLMFDDVKKTIADDFKNYQIEKIMKIVRERLWKKYDVKVYSEVLLRKIAPGS